jgi:hypothetical protein
MSRPHKVKHSYSKSKYQKLMNEKKKVKDELKRQSRKGRSH